MNNQSTIRNRKNKAEEKVYPFVVRKDLYEEIEYMAYSNDVSVAHFIRESVKRNLAAYKKAALV
jgi:hypothetical protein